MNDIENQSKSLAQSHAATKACTAVFRESEMNGGTRKENEAMRQVKTKREIYVGYMCEIDLLEDEITQLDHDIERMGRKKINIFERISELKETAEMFNPELLP